MLGKERLPKSKMILTLRFPTTNRPTSRETTRKTAADHRYKSQAFFAIDGHSLFKRRNSCGSSYRHSGFWTSSKPETGKENWNSEAENEGNHIAG